MREVLFIAAAFAVCVCGRSVQPATSNVEEDFQCGVPGCHYDLQLFCLSNGVIVMGTCSLKNLLCTDGVRNNVNVADGWDTCFDATYSTQHIDPQMVLVHTSKESKTGSAGHAQPAPHTPVSAGDLDLDVAGQDTHADVMGGKVHADQSQMAVSAERGQQDLAKDQRAADAYIMSPENELEGHIRTDSHNPANTGDSPRRTTV